MLPNLPLLLLAALLIQSAHGRDGNNRNTGRNRNFRPRSRLSIGHPWLSDAILNKWILVATTTSTEKPVTTQPPTNISYPEYATYPTFPTFPTFPTNPLLEPAIITIPQPAQPAQPAPLVPTSAPDALDPPFYAAKEDEIEKEQYKEDKGADEDDEYDEYIFGLMPNTSENSDKDLIEFNDPELIDLVSRSRSSRWRRRQQPMTSRTKRRHMANKRRHVIQRRRFTNEYQRGIHRRMKRINSQKPCTQLRRNNHVLTENRMQRFSRRPLKKLII